MKLSKSTIILTYLSTFVQSSPLLDALARIHLTDRQFENPFNVHKRDCANPCGYYGQLCCQAGQSCVTDSNNQAQCGGPVAAAAVTTGAGSWQVYTSIWTETGLLTKTSVYSSWVPAATGNVQCNYAAQESLCGTTCCKSGYYCNSDTQCIAAGNGGFTTSGVVGTIPARPTTISGVIVTQTVSPTTTMALQTPVMTGAAGATVTTSHKLSGGAIAGIVIGVLLALALLWLLIFCFCLNALCGCLGLKKKKRSRGSRSTVIEEEDYVRHHHHAGAAAAGGRTWVGGSRRSRSSSDRHSRRPSRPPAAKKTNWLGAITAGAATAAAFSIFRKNKNKKTKTEKSGTSYTGSSYDSYYSYDDSVEERTRVSRGPSRGPSRPPRSSGYTSRSRSVRP